MVSVAIRAIIHLMTMAIATILHVTHATHTPVMNAIPHLKAVLMMMVKFIVIIATTMWIHRAIVCLVKEATVILVTHILTAPRVEQIHIMNGMMMRNDRNITVRMTANTALTMMVIVVIHLVRIVALNAVAVVQKPSAIMAQVVRTNVKEIADSVIAMIHTFPIVLIVEITRTLRALIVTEIFGVTTKTVIPVITSARN